MTTEPAAPVFPLRRVTDVYCSTCDSDPIFPCITVYTGRPTTTHAARRRAFEAARQLDQALSMEGAVRLLMAP